MVAAASTVICAVVACKGATEVKLDIRTNANCKDPAAWKGVAVYVGRPGEDVESKAALRRGGGPGAEGARRRARRALRADPAARLDAEAFVQRRGRPRDAGRQGRRSDAARAATCPRGGSEPERRAGRIFHADARGHAPGAGHAGADRRSPREERQRAPPRPLAADRRRRARRRAHRRHDQSDDRARHERRAARSDGAEGGLPRPSRPSGARTPERSRPGRSRGRRLDRRDESRAPQRFPRRARRR